MPSANCITVTVVISLLCCLNARGSSLSRSNELGTTPEGVDLDVNNRIEVTHEGNVIDSTRTANGHLAAITVTVWAFSQVFSINLKLNTFLFAADYVEKSFDENGPVFHKVNHAENNCYYLGKVKNEESSSAAISTCAGIVGHFSIKNISYHIESQSGRIQGPHKVYRSRGDAKSVYKCGKDQVPLDNLMNPSKHAQRLKRSFMWPQDLTKMNKVVELYVAIENSEYNNSQRSIATATQRAKDIVNAANAGFQPIGITVMLVGMEVWDSGNKITVNTSDASSTLFAWSEYRKRNITPTTYNDIGILITHTIFTSGGDTVGYAYINQMCSNNLSVAIVADVNQLATVAGAIMDHEIGHSFGLKHDDQFNPCPCSDPTGNCIMKPAPSQTAPSVTWSQCSLDQFASSFHNGSDLCLYNIPNIIYPNTGYCGNGIVETGEQCDCGNSTSQQCNKSCCVNCQLVAPATCAYGRCCNINTCQILPRGDSCRAKADAICDLEEFCDGTAATCADDTYVPDGTSCTTTGAAAYCYKGLCQNRESQCALLWGPGTQVSTSDCYDLNARGEFYGNCGFNWLPSGVSFNKCATSDVMCGILQCQNLALPLYTYTHFITGGALKFPNGNTCHSVVFDYGLSVRDPGLVPNGAPCGTGMMCVNQTCVNVSTFTSTFTISCSGCTTNQVCNNVGRCQDTAAAFIQTASTSVSSSSSTTASTPTTTSSTSAASTASQTPASPTAAPSQSKSNEPTIIAITLGVVLGAMALAVVTSLVLCGCCCPEFFSYCCGSCWPWAPAKSAALISDEPFADLPTQMGPVPMPARMHWTPANNYFSTPPSSEIPEPEPLERPSEVYYPQTAPNWTAMRRVRPFWGNENSYRFKLNPERLPEF